jgi:hypothetical protein
MHDSENVDYGVKLTMRGGINLSSKTGEGEGAQRIRNHRRVAWHYATVKRQLDQRAWEKRIPGYS